MGRIEKFCAYYYILLQYGRYVYLLRFPPHLSGGQDYSTSSALDREGESRL